MPAWNTYRTVVYDALASGFLTQNTQPGDRFEDQWRGIEWLLSRTPGIGLPRDKQIPGRFNVVVVAGNPAARTREVWVLYSYEDHEVTVHAIRFGP
jgi:hypothetical protein